MNKILKGKTRNQMIDDFTIMFYDNKVSRREFMNGAKDAMKRPTNKTLVWGIAIFMWMFCLSWMIQAIIAMSEGFFWYPIDTEIESILSFINIFWALLWFIIPIVIIIHYINKIVGVYNYNDDRY